MPLSMKGKERGDFHLLEELKKNPMEAPIVESNPKVGCRSTTASPLVHPWLKHHLLSVTFFPEVLKHINHLLLRDPSKTGTAKQQKDLTLNFVALSVILNDSYIS